MRRGLVARRFALDVVSRAVMKAYFGDGGRLLFAHRGGAKRFPENTMHAFEQAYALGFRWIETDVHLSADGTIVVHHDPTLERTTNGQGRLRDRTLAELRTLDAGYRFTRDGRTYPHRGRGLTIPTLEEAFALAPDLRLNLEMKGDDPNLPKALYEFLEHHGLRDRALVAAGKDVMTERFRTYAGDRYATSPGITGITRFWAAVRARVDRFVDVRFDALQVPPSHGMLTVVEPRFVEAAHRRGLKVHVWTIDDPAEMRRLAALGVDGVMSDRPEALMETLG
ncbi:MAG: glycerophosphodiester phosphodiesterase [Sandaracinus sp.]|nr:glycerophosphodiester phosphodiesterase [Sandaracinus sp.]